jgi:hypothetical protein
MEIVCCQFEPNARREWRVRDGETRDGQARLLRGVELSGAAGREAPATAAGGRRPAQVAATRAAEKAHRDAERALAAAARASAEEKKAAEKEAGRLHVESRLAEVESLNASLASTLAEIDGLLAATLEVDDYVDLESLKIRTVEHPPFEAGDLAVPVAPMPELVYPPEPVYEEPPAPSVVGL